MRERRSHLGAFRGGAAHPRRDRPRVLFLTCHLPWPALSGGRLRELELIKRLSRRFDIRLIAVTKTAEDLENAPALAEFCRSVEVFAAEPSGAYGGAVAPQVLRHHAPAAGARIEQILACERVDRGVERVDLIHVEGFYLMQHVPDWTDAPILLVEQNVEYDLERQRARAAAAGVPQLSAFSRCASTHAAELSAWRRATQIAAVTAEDREMIRAELPAARVGLVPDGADHLPAPRMGASEPIDRPAHPLIVLVANFAYSPNVDAAHHLCREIMPQVRAAVPEAALWLVGNAPGDEIRALAGPQTRVTGTVADVMPYLDAADLVICPLRVGGGIKVKTIEALRRGKAIVSTSVGAQGLPAEARRAMRIADDPGAFARAVVGLLRDDDGRHALGVRAAGAAELLPSWDEAAAALGSVYDELLDDVPDEPQIAAARRSA